MSASKDSLLETLNQKLKEQNIEPGLLVEKTAVPKEFWTRDVSTNFGFVQVRIEKGRVLLYLGLEAVDSTQVYMVSSELTTRNIFLAFKFLHERHLIYLRVGSDTFLAEFIRNFKILGNK